MQFPDPDTGEVRQPLDELSLGLAGVTARETIRGILVDHGHEEARAGQDLDGDRDVLFADPIEIAVVGRDGQLARALVQLVGPCRREHAQRAVGQAHVVGLWRWRADVPLVAQKPGLAVRGRQALFALSRIGHTLALKEARGEPVVKRSQRCLADRVFVLGVGNAQPQIHARRPLDLGERGGLGDELAGKASAQLGHPTLNLVAERQDLGPQRLSDGSLLGHHRALLAFDLALLDLVEDDDDGRDDRAGPKPELRRQRPQAHLAAHDGAPPLGAGLRQRR